MSFLISLVRKRRTPFFNKYYNILYVIWKDIVVLLQCCSIAVSKVAFYCPGSKRDWFVRREWLVVKGVFRIWWRGGGGYIYWPNFRLYFGFFRAWPLRVENYMYTMNNVQYEIAYMEFPPPYWYAGRQAGLEFVKKCNFYRLIKDNSIEGICNCQGRIERIRRGWVTTS